MRRLRQTLHCIACAVAAMRKGLMFQTKPQLPPAVLSPRLVLVHLGTFHAVSNCNSQLAASTAKQVEHRLAPLKRATETFM